MDKVILRLLAEVLGQSWMCREVLVIVPLNKHMILYKFPTESCSKAHNLPHAFVA